MYDGIRNYFIKCALADYGCYVDYKGIKQVGQNVDIRLAMHACSSMLHLADHVLDELKTTLEARGIKSLREYHTHLAKRCADFCVVRDCANAHKHRSLTEHSPCISGAESIQEVVVLTEYKDTEGPYRIAEKKEVYVRKRIRPRPLYFNQNQPLGHSRFYAKIETMTGQRREAKPRGRPRVDHDESAAHNAGQGKLGL